MKAFFFFFALAIPFQIQAGTKIVEGNVGPFHVQPGEDVGVEIGEARTLIRLCQPQRVEVDVTYYLYHRLNSAQLAGKPVKVIYTERAIRDAVTGRNKLCLVELIY